MTDANRRYDDGPLHSTQARLERQGALKQVASSRVIQGLFVLLALIGGGAAADVPGRLAAHATIAPAPAAISAADVEAALASSLAYQLERHRVDEMEKQLGEMRGQVQFLYEAELRRQGREGR